ncbi:hypothetical protein [Nocardia wallacei]|uniref:hypothetical protein n=1 Tax=Nocardia wallacei TaxID=480035 RepID=UPI0024551F8E|nr:hypothetical protein [Nocardia wallacei]
MDDEGFEPGTQVTRAAADAEEIGVIIDAPDVTTASIRGGLCSVEWADGTCELLPAAALTARTLTALLETSHGRADTAEWTIEVATVEIPLGAPGRCEHIFTLCEDCADQWASDYIFLDPWPDDWTRHSTGPL